MNPRSPARAAQRVAYRVEVADPNAHLLRVSLTVPRPPPEQQWLSLPVWIPGSYLVREFARHLSGLQARQDGRELALRQPDKASWVAHCSGTGALTVTYLVYAFDVSVRSAYLDARRGFFNGTSVFLRVHGREHEPRQAVSIDGLPGLGCRHRDAGAGRRHHYLAADYDELVDHPFELGRFWRGSSRRGRAHEFVVAGALPASTARG